MSHLFAVLLRTHLALSRARRGERDERGDVPGWVLVTMMTVGLVMAIWSLAEEELKQMLQAALDKVKS